jgi:hypothetical protein
MPLFKLLPGRPRSTFFSSSFFFGAILRRSREDEATKLREAMACREKGERRQMNRAVALNRSAKADPAAECWNWPADEVNRGNPWIAILEVEM